MGAIQSGSPYVIFIHFGGGSGAASVKSRSTWMTHIGAWQVLQENEVDNCRSCGCLSRRHTGGQLTTVVDAKSIAGD